MRPSRIVVALALLAMPHLALAQGDDKADADRRFSKGVELYKSGDLAAALVEFKKAYELAPNYKVLYNIGQLYAQVFDHQNAIRSYQQYLKDGGDQIPRARKAEVNAELKKLIASAAKLTVTADVAGAEVSVDDAVVGTLPMSEPIYLNAGKHNVTVKAAGQPPSSKPIQVKNGESASLAFTIAPQPVLIPDKPKEPTSKPAEAAPPPDKKPSVEIDTSKKPIPWVPWVVTGGLAVGTIVTGILATSAVGKYDDKKNTFGVTKSDLEDAQGTARLWTYIAGGFGVATVVAGGLSLYLTLSSSSSTRTSLVVGPSSLQLRGSF